MFGFIKNLFGGIFGFLGRLLGFKKSQYFMEIEDTAGGTAVLAAPPSAKPEPAKAVATKQESAKPKTAAPAPAPAPAPTAKAEPPKAKATKEKKSKPAKEAAPVATAQPAKTAPAERNGSQPVGGFATLYLMPTPTATRRRPGANMNPFLDMARQVKPAR